MTGWTTRGWAGAAVVLVTSAIAVQGSAAAPGTATPIGAVRPATASVRTRVVPSPRPATTVSSTGRSLPADPLVPARYLRQTVRWQPCFTVRQLAEEDLPRSFLRLLCAQILAPLDWENPESGTDVVIAVSKLPATNPVRDRAGRSLAPIVFTNPGGPGAPGRTLPLVFLEMGRTRLTAAQDIYGIDVRGTGDSTSITCGLWSQVMIDYRDPSADAADLILDLAAAHARSCRLFGGARGAQVTTAQTVRDLDLLRRLAGRERVNWVGYSAGTWLGARYATAFPRHVGRFVFDSSTEFTADWQKTFSWQPMSFQRRFEEDFAVWAAAHDDYLGLGSTAGAVVDYVERLRSDLADNPRELPFAGVLNGPILDSLIADALYSKASFQELAEVLVLLRALADGAPELSGSGAAAAVARIREVVTAARRTARFGASRPDSAPVGSDSYDATFYATACQDTPWTGDRSSLTAEARTAGLAYPLLGWSTIDQPCVFWDRTGAPAVPVVRGAGVPPVLMVQSVHDPATALEGAENAAALFAGARLLKVTNEGDHGLYASGNSCVDGAVEAFLLRGVLPAVSATCTGTGVPALGASRTSLSALRPAVSFLTPGSPGSWPSARGRRWAGVPSVSSAPARGPLGRARELDAALG